MGQNDDVLLEEVHFRGVLDRGSTVYSNVHRQTKPPGYNLVLMFFL